MSERMLSNSELETLERLRGKSKNPEFLNQSRKIQSWKYARLRNERKNRQRT